MRNHVVLAGQYSVVRNDAEDNACIESPDVQSCVVLVLRSSIGTAVAHIDTPFYAREITQAMIQKLKSFDKKMPIEATIIGGDVAYVPGGIDSSTLYNPVYKTLNEHQIKFSHKNYSYAAPPVHFVYLLFRMLDLVGPASYLLAALCFVALWTLGQGAIGTFLGNSYDVRIVLKSGAISITSNSEDNAKRIRNEATAEQKDSFLRRNKLDPQNPKNIKELKLTDAASQVKPKAKTSSPR